MSGGSPPARIVSVGALTWESGYPYALLAVRKLLDDTGAQVSYRIHGDGEDRTQVLFTIADLELEGRVEPGPRTGLLAAAAAGLPAVATDLGEGAPWALVPPRDADAAAAALARALALEP